MVRAAASLDVLLRQINIMAPNRSKTSDGGIGDKAHAARVSDHNPDANGVYHARDFTHDPANGMDIHSFADQLTRDARVTYVISMSRFFDKVNGQVRIRNYRDVNRSATNMHEKHLHVSVAEGALGEDTSPWNIGPNVPYVPPAPAPAPQRHPSLDLPAVRSRPRSFQRWYNDYPFRPALLPIIKPLADNFGPQSLAALKKVQGRYGLVADGIDGPLTRRVLWDLGWRG